MRAVAICLAFMAAFVWLTAESRLGRPDWGDLPISASRPPTRISDLPIPDPHRLDDLRVVPAARAAARDGKTVYVTGSNVNLRAGPGLDRRMITVAERGDALAVDGEEVSGWLPVTDLATGATAWVSSDHVQPTPPAR